MYCHNNDTKGVAGVTAEIPRVAANLPPSSSHKPYHKPYHKREREHKPPVMPDLPTSPFVMSDDVLDRHCTRFYELFNQYLNGKEHHNIQPMTEDDYDQRVTFLKMLNSGSTLTELKNTYSQAYQWSKKFELVVFGTSEKLVFKADVTVPLDQRKQVLHRGNIFKAIYAIHTGAEGNGCVGHRMARTFHTACADRYGKSSPQWVTNLLCKTCPVCISKNTRKKLKAGCSKHRR